MLHVYLLCVSSAKQMERKIEQHTCHLALISSTTYCQHSILYVILGELPRVALGIQMERKIEQHTCHQALISSTIYCQHSILYVILGELPRVALGKRQPLKKPMTPCTTQSSFVRAMTTSCPKNHVQLLVSRSVRKNVCGRLS